jgi:8-oxo-dGTP pyrophosphatase MutT (NUDIX family)
MLQRIPAPLHRAGLQFAHAARKLWWAMRRPQLIGCRVLALDMAGCVLLVRHSYGSGRWSMPGGGVGRNEDPVTAALRELREETGFTLIDARELMVAVEQLSGARNQVHIVAGKASGKLQPDGREVIEARFFPPDGLPEDTASGLARHIPTWIERYGA